LWSSQASPNPSDWGRRAAPRSSSPARQDEGPIAPRGEAHYPRIVLQRLSQP
jgi:hypothetical protein